MSVRVKICGIRDEAALEAAMAAGADFIGLVFFPPSPRNVSMEQAARLAAMARGRVKTVALVVDADDELLTAIAREARPDYLQLHGGETPRRVDEISKIVEIPLIKAFRVRDEGDIRAAKDYSPHIAFPLFDAWVSEEDSGGLPGGSGHSFDWRLLKEHSSPFMLAGGLTPRNVAAAIGATGAPMVDVSSGVESSRGVKDAGKIRAFIEAAKGAGSSRRSLSP